MESRKRAWITLQQLLQKSKTYRDEGKQVMKSNSLIAAKQCYNEALNCLVPGFQRLTALDDETKLPLKEEIAIIFGNLSLVNLRQGNPEEAYQNAHQSIAYNPTAKGHYRLAEACSYSPMHCKEALTNYHTSYSLEEDITTYCKYFILAVGVGHNPVVPEVLETYTPMLEKLICQPQFNFIHLEVLLLKQCSIPIPNIKCGIAIQKCSTFCIKELSALMKLGLQWNLVVALINHGTVPDEAAIEVSIHIYNKSVSTLFIAEKVLGVVQYDHLLSLAISKEWHGQFVNYCISQGGKFSPNDIWSVLKWKDDSKIKSLFKKLLKNGGSVNVKNSKGQCPLNFLLENNMFTRVLILLKYNADTSAVDITNLITKLIKLKAGVTDYSIKALKGIIECKGTIADIKDELNASLTVAFKSEHYELAALLIEYGADITHITDKSTTPVHVATTITLHIKDKMSILQNVLDSYKQLPPKLVDDKGQLPHHLVVSVNTEFSEAVLKVLIRYPFDLSTKNEYGKTALQCCNRKRKKLKSILECKTEKVMVSTPTTDTSKNQADHNISSNKSIQLTNDDAMKDTQPSGTKAAEDNDDDSEMTSVQRLKKLKIKVEKICCITDQTLFQSDEDSELKMDANDKVSVKHIKPNAKDVSTTINTDANSHADIITTIDTTDVSTLTDVAIAPNVATTADVATVTATINVVTTTDMTTTSQRDISKTVATTNEINNNPAATNIVTATYGATNAVFDGNKLAQETVSFEDCAWEVECTETFWKELAEQDENFRKLVFSKIHRLAEGEWHYKFCKPLVGTDKLFELRINKSMRIIWEKAMTFSPRCSSKPTHCHNDLPTEVYSDVIRIWSLVLDHDKLDTCIKQIEKSNVKGLESVIKKNLVCRKLSSIPGEQATREKIPHLYDVIDENQHDTSYSYHPPASAKDNEYNVVTFYSFSNEFVKSILTQKSRMDFPFKGWPKENEIINLDHSESILLLGRSGTGKTTCCLYRLWNQFKCYWETATDPCIPREALIKYKLNTNTEDEDENKFEDDTDDFTQHDEVSNDASRRLSNEDDTPASNCDTNTAVLTEGMDSEIPRPKFDEADEGAYEFCKEHTDNFPKELNAESDSDNVLSNEPKPVKYITFDHLQQVFITKNNVLCTEFKEKFYDMAHTVDKLQGHLKFEKKCHLHSLQDLNPYAYPLFLTTYEWLQLLDNSLDDDTPFFPRNPDGSLAIEIEYSCDGNTEDLTMMEELDNSDSNIDTGEQLQHITVRRKTWQKIDADFFCDVLWPQVTKRICDSTQISPLLVWMEIRSFIKGSFQALQTANGYLSLDEYQNLGHKMAPNFADKKHLVYKLFEKYEQIKRWNNCFDECELVFNLFQRLSKLDDINWCIHQFYIDEVQDFTQAELTLLLQCCRWPNGLFLTGDTAQSIMRGVSFRFSDLRSVFHYISKHVDTSKGQKVKIKVPKLHTLTQNFRSHSGILQLAASVIDLLMHFFGSSLDKLPSDQGMFPGPKPVLLLSCNYSDLSLLLTGNEREASAIEFGAKQAIIVQFDGVKKKLRKELDAIVLTVFESKGLEFDDVLLYDFFFDSKADEEWRVVVKYLEDHPKLICSKESAYKPQPIQFDECKHKMLNSELKLLYTALTRARCNLWIYDSNPDKRSAMFYYFQKRGLVRVLSASFTSDGSGGETVFTKKSSTAEWKQKGDYYREKNKWEAAIFCYKKAGMEDLVQEAKAYYNIHEGKQSRNKRHVTEMKNYFLRAAMNFLNCFDLQLSIKWIEKAASWLFNASEYGLAALLFIKLDKVDDAIKAYQRDGQFQAAADLYKKQGKVDKAIKSLLLDPQGNLLPEALKLAMDYTNGENSLPLDPGCSINVIAQRTAEFYLRNNKVGKAKGCTEFFTESRDKVSLLKRANLKDEALELLIAEKNYSEIYRLFKGWELFERGAEVAEKLGDSSTHCDFLLHAVKQKLQGKEDYVKECKLEDANNLEKAGAKLSSVDTQLLVWLMCAILREDPTECFNVCQRFKHANNHFGAIEALNAAFKFREPNFDLKKVEITATLEKIGVITDCMQYAQDILNEIKSSGKLTKNLQLSKCRKFYQLEQSEDIYFSSPSQYFAMRRLSKCCKSRDCDGMIQFNQHVLNNMITKHFCVIVDNWKELELETVLYKILNSDKYTQLNLIIDKKSDKRNFAETCCRVGNIQEYLHCCIKLVEVASSHNSNSMRDCNLIGIDDWESLLNYGSDRIVSIFSPQWSYYLPFSRKEVEMVKRSRSVCKCLQSKMEFSSKIKGNINAFLFNWRICKLTNCSLKYELERCLEEEEAKWTKVKQKETELKENNTIKEEISDQRCKTEKKKGKKQKHKDEKSKEHDEIPGVLAQTESGYSHEFFKWLRCCRQLENGNFMGFAEGVIRRLLFSIVKTESIKPKLKVLNLISVLEVVCTGLLGSLKVTNVKRNLHVLLPESYEHTLTVFDAIVAGKYTLLNSITNTSAESVYMEKVFDSARYLLQETLWLLLGRVVQSFNALRYAALLSATVINNGFKRCLELCLCLFGNLYPIMHPSNRQKVYQILCKILNLVLKKNALQLNDFFPELHDIVKQLSTTRITNSNYIQCIFSILFKIQQRYKHSLVSLQFDSKNVKIIFKSIQIQELEGMQQVCNTRWQSGQYPNTQYQQQCSNKWRTKNETTMKQNQESLGKIGTTKHYKVEKPLSKPHANDQAEHTTDTNVHIIHDTLPEPNVTTQPCVDTITSVPNTAPTSLEATVSHPLNSYDKFKANHKEMHESSHSVLQLPINQDFIDAPAALSTSLSIIPPTADSEHTVDVITESSIMPPSTTGSRYFHTNDERESDATMFNANDVPCESTKYSSQQLSNIEQFPTATNSAVLSSSVLTQPLNATSYNAYHQHSLKFFQSPQITMIPPVSMVPMIPYGTPMIAPYLPMPGVQPGQYYPMTYDGQYVGPYTHGYETESAFQDTTMDEYDYEATEMEPHTDFELTDYVTTVNYNTTSFQDDISDEDYTVTEMGYYTDFEQIDDTDYDTMAFQATTTNEEHFPVEEMQFYRDIPLATDSVVDTTIQSDHCPICDVNINELGNEHHLVSQEHVIMESHYKEYHKIKSKYESTVAEAETLITLTKGGSKTILQHQIHKIMDSKVNFGRSACNIEENLLWQNGQMIIEKCGGELAELINSYYVQLKASELTD